MIVPMDKVFVVARTQDRQNLLETLSRLSVVHLTAVDPKQARPDEQCVTRIDKLTRALQMLSTVASDNASVDIDPIDAADEIITIQRESMEQGNRLAALHQKMDQLAIWGDVTLDQFEQLRKAGVDIRFFLVPVDQLGQVKAECVQPINEPSGKAQLIAVIDRKQSLSLPEQAKPIDLPAMDRPGIRAEAARIDQKLKQNTQRLQQLAGLIPQLEAKRLELENQAAFTIAERGGFDNESLFSVQGWVPRDKAETLADDLAKAHLPAAVKVLPPESEETPPTLIKYPRWAKPIQGLFDILGTLPGYKELDLAPFFMVALPFFAAMLIGDAGYGLVLLTPCLLFYRKMLPAVGKAKLHLLMVVASATLVWGIISANYFGLTPESFAQAGGFVKTQDGHETPDVVAMQAGQGVWAGIGKSIIAVAPLWNKDAVKMRNLLIKLSLLIGCIHLTIAHMCRFFGMFPNIRALAEVGWGLFLWAMFALIWLLFFGKNDGPFMPTKMMILLGGVGFALFVLFTSPSRNPLKMVGIGFASSLLPMLGTFSDTMSYIRLMAVGLASSYIAAAFNSLGGSVAESATWFAAAPIVLFGHTLNLGLALIAVFAHGVRLNMLEFSNNAAVQWSGYAFAPFAKKQQS